MSTLSSPSSSSEKLDQEHQPEIGIHQHSDETSEQHISSSDAVKELEAVKAALKKANAEAASHRHKANELDRLKAEIEASKLSETEKLQKQLSELQLQHEQHMKASQEKIINYEVRVQAASMGIVDPDAATKLLSKDEIEYSDGEPTNIEHLLKALVKAKPYLIGKQSTSFNGSTVTNPSRSGSNGNQLSWEAITAMTAEQYAARRVEIQAFMKKNPAKR